MTNIELANFCREAAKLPTLYLWGTYGRVITKSLLADKAKQYPGRYSSTRQDFIRKHINGIYRGCDCAGLIKWALWTQGDIKQTPRYSSKTDRGTGGLYSAAKEKGPIAVLPEQQGVVVYKNGHVGVYVGSGKVIECTLGKRGDGVVETDLQDGGWTHWLRIPEVDYLPAATGKPISVAKKQNILQKLGILFRKGDEK